MRFRLGGLAAALVCAGVAAGPSRAEVGLDNAWMRPALAGQAQAAVYVDIRSGVPLRLVGAASPIAKSTQLVRVESPGEDAGRVVAELPVTAPGDTRLALLGSHVRLLDVTRDVHAGERWPLELVFVDAAGKRLSATTEVVVRGLMPRRSDPEAERSPGTR